MFDFKNMAPAKKKRLLIFGVVSVVIVASYAVTKLSKRETYSGLNTSTDVEVLIPKKKNTTVEGLAAQLLAMEKRMQEMDRYVRSIEPNLKEAVQQKLTQYAEGKPTDEEKRLKALEDKIEVLLKEMQEGKGLGGVESPLKRPKEIEALERGGGGEKTVELPGEPFGDETVYSTGELRVIGTPESEGKGEESRDREGRRKRKALRQTDFGGVSDRDLQAQAGEDEEVGDQEAFIPSGSIIQGVLLSGLDAPTGSRASKNPVPALVRIKHEAVLPNRFREDVKECFVIVSGYGSLSTERANLRSERLSCVRPDGGVIETSLDGWVIGEDGKAGMRGRLVSKQGRVIANSIVAGVLSGLAGSFRPAQVPMLNLNPTTRMQYQYPTPEGVFGNAGLVGANTALEKIANYYLEMADEIFPIVEIDAGRKMTIVLVKGTRLKL